MLQTSNVTSKQFPEQTEEHTVNVDVKEEEYKVYYSKELQRTYYDFSVTSFFLPFSSRVFSLSPGFRLTEVTHTYHLIVVFIQIDL